MTQTLKSLDKSNKSLQVGMVVTDKYTGGIAAMVGDKTLDLMALTAVEIRRPIGSLIKPFVYATALAPNSQFTLATPLKDQPITLKSEQGKTWSPQNFDKKFSGQAPLLTALKKSMNVLTVNLGIAVGVDAVATTLAKSGWQSR